MTRRALLGGGAALLLAGCGDRSPAQAGDAAVLAELVAIEERLAAASSGRLAARARRHAARLRAAGAGRGGNMPAAVRDAAGDLALARAAYDAYLEALTRLHDPAHRELVLALSADQAQNVSVALARLGRDPLPDAFAGTVSA